MNINNKLTLGVLAVANIAAGGTIGLAADTVDWFSSFDVNQTTAAQTLSLPAPTVSEDGQLAVVRNVGTANFIMHGRVVDFGTGVIYQWHAGSSTWIPLADPGGNAKMYYEATALVAMTPLVVTHNLALTLPDSATVSVVDGNGDRVDVRITATAANSVTIQSNAAVAVAKISVIGY